MEGVTIYLFMSLHSVFFPTISFFFYSNSQMCLKKKSVWILFIRITCDISGTNIKTHHTHTRLIQYKCVQWILASLSYSCKASQGKRINYKDVLTSSGLYITLHSPIVDICIDTLQMYSWQLVVHNCEQYHNAKH